MNQNDIQIEKVANAVQKLGEAVMPLVHLIAEKMEKIASEMSYELKALEKWEYLKSQHSSYREVKVPEKYILRSDMTITKIYNWLNDNHTGDYFVHPFHAYILFERDEDAVMFVLNW